jgi:hypothetical protein
VQREASARSFSFSFHFSFLPDCLDYSLLLLCHLHGTDVPCPVLRLVAIVPIDAVGCFLPEVPAEELGGGFRNAAHASVLCGNRFCGGSLDLQAAVSASNGPGHAFSLFGSSVKLLLVKGLGVRPVAPPFRRARPVLFLDRKGCYQSYFRHLFLRSPLLLKSE